MVQGCSESQHRVCDCEKKITLNFFLHCRNTDPSSGDEGRPTHKVVLTTELCIIIRQLISLSSTPAAPLLCWDSVPDVGISAPTQLPQAASEGAASTPRTKSFSCSRSHAWTNFIFIYLFGVFERCQGKKGQK